RLCRSWRTSCPFRPPSCRSTASMRPNCTAGRTCRRADAEVIISRWSRDHGLTYRRYALDMAHATFVSPDLSTFARLDELGLSAVGQRLTVGRAVLECRLTDPDPWCRGCGGTGDLARDDHAVPGARAVRSSAHHAAGPGAPLPVRSLWQPLAGGHHRRGTTAGQALAGRDALGVGSAG